MSDISILKLLKACPFQRYRFQFPSKSNEIRSQWKLSLVLKQKNISIGYKKDETRQCDQAYRVEDWIVLKKSLMKKIKLGLVKYMERENLWELGTSFRKIDGLSVRYIDPKVAKKAVSLELILSKNGAQ